ncbi:aspartate carbamoyltransferase catalytic subunit [Armatimonas sp.]|uniref:aspartate carbamoyltransferase catalytic subunit n=1 Tax=Armatimonas sp. TaxID=1872638 RepID=UPI00286BB7A0|nr:aspartate carbamoyltransferase catalytic subunit [Armatimonas sp.]
MNLAGRDLLGLEGLEREAIEMILDNATTFSEVLRRDVKKVPTLRGKSVITMFFENSTRTRSSFEAAGKYMSADVINISGNASSASKGESLRDTFLTLQALTADLVIMRTPFSGACHQAAEWVDIPVVNAGDGMHEHPTQGLLDALTIRDAKGSIEGLKVAIVGDVLHSRVARSNIWGLNTLGADVHLIGPKTLLPTDADKLPVTVHTNLEEGLEDADVVMVLRLQLERQSKALFPTPREYCNLFGVSKKALRAAKPDAIILHPGPMNRGLEISGDVPDLPRAVIEKQVTNGVATRMAVLYLLLGAEG